MVTATSVEPKFRSIQATAARRRLGVSEAAVIFAPNEAQGAWRADRVHFE